jgi:preprotein translocase subunit SecY
MSWKVIWQSLKNQDMRRRVLAVLGMILIFRILAHIPIPIGDGTTLKQILETLFTSKDTPQFLSFVDVLSGGALANFSIMLVGMGPYINASIIMQLLTRAIPKLEALNKEGEYGRKKINQYTRILTLPLAIIQSVGTIYLVRQTAAQIGGLGDITAGTSISQWILMITALSGGALLLMWLGELITEESIGNGISLVITVGIVSHLPQTLVGVITTVATDTDKLHLGPLTLPFTKQVALYTLIMIAVVIIVTVLLVKLNEAARNLTIHYAKRVQGNRAYGGVTTKLPIKLITAGVIPIIFASVFLTVPTFVGQLMAGSGNTQWQQWGLQLTKWFQQPTYGSFSSGAGLHPFIYPIIYFGLVFIFTFFYTSITFNATEIAENLQKQGGFIEGIRSGQQTEKYLSKVVNRLTLFGALCLGLLAIAPIIAQVYIPAKIALGGTSILILVAVALETLRQIESRALMVTYDQYDQPDFFYESTVPATGARRLRLFAGKKNRK